MKMLTVSFFLCAMMALTRAAALPEATPETRIEEPASEQHYIADYWTPMPSMPPITDFFFSCPDGWTMFSTRCLFYVATKMTWSEAEQNCAHLAVNEYGNLASVYDSEAAAEIHGMLKKAGQEHGKVWVGGFNTEKDPSWSWNDFLGVAEFHDFCSKKHEHHCLQMNYEENKTGCLDDVDCETKLPSMCAVILM